MNYRRGFAVVFAVDVPDVHTVDNPPGKLPSRLPFIAHQNMSYVSAAWDKLCPVYDIFANQTTG